MIKKLCIFSAHAGGITRLNRDADARKAAMDGPISH
jgi:hypothetical protein